MHVFQSWLHGHKQAWQHGDDIGDEDVLRALVSREGFDPQALIFRTQNNVIKEELRKNTADAESYGGR